MLWRAWMARAYGIQADRIGLMTAAQVDDVLQDAEQSGLLQPLETLDED